jgi:hypothetical protein
MQELWGILPPRKSAFFATGWVGLQTKQSKGETTKPRKTSWTAVSFLTKEHRVILAQLSQAAQPFRHARLILTGKVQED